MRMFVQQQRMLKRVPPECIDLCSSSEEDNGDGDEDENVGVRDGDVVVVINEGKEEDGQEEEDEEDEVVIVSSSIGEEGSLRRRPGPKGAMERSLAKRQRLLLEMTAETVVGGTGTGTGGGLGHPKLSQAPSEEDEMKENRFGGGMGMLKGNRMNHSAIQEMAVVGVSSSNTNGSRQRGESLSKPLSVSVVGAWTGTATATAATQSAQMAGSPQTAAQLGVILPNPAEIFTSNHNHNRSSLNNNSSNANNSIVVGNNLHLQHQRNHSDATALFANANISSIGTTTTTPGQPSSYLFLTKQQLVYQQLEVSSTVAETRVTAGHEVEQEVAPTPPPPPPTTNSSLTGRVNPTFTNIARHTLIQSVVDQAKDQAKDQSNPGDLVGTATGESAKHSILSQSQVGVRAITAATVGQGQEPPPSTSNNNRSNIKVGARKSLPARGNAKQAAQSSTTTNTTGAGPRLRRTSTSVSTSSVCDSFPLPKKMPSLIRIAPA